MEKPRIPKDEFTQRIEKIRQYIKQNRLKAILVYGDEYRKENLRYVSNYWPIFERGALLISMIDDPILLCAPEGEMVAREMSVWQDIRLIPDFLCVTVPDAIDYPLAKYSSFSSLANELRSRNGKIDRLGIVGIDAMSHVMYESILTAFNCELVDCNKVLHSLRKTKSKNEIACLTQAAYIADHAYQTFMNTPLIGMTELAAAGIIEGASRKEGAEQIVFTVFGSGERTNTIVGRPTDKKICNGDMIMCALAVQYEGYVATCEVPFGVGSLSDETRRVIDVLIEARSVGLPYLCPGVPMKEFVKAVKDYFKQQRLSQYDIYPPLHGIGCAEAESPYPDQMTEEPFTVGTTVNIDISLFGLPGGSNRIEEGFIITEDGAESLSPFVYSYCDNWIVQKRSKKG